MSNLKPSYHGSDLFDTLDNIKQESELCDEDLSHLANLDLVNLPTATTSSHVSASLPLTTTLKNPPDYIQATSPNTNTVTVLQQQQQAPQQVP